MTNLTDLEAAIRKLLPDTMELKFGCEIEHSVAVELNIPYRGMYLHPARGKDMHLIFFRASGEGSQQDYSTTINQKDFEILGRPLDLPDVLRAIWNSPGESRLTACMVDFQGQFISLSNVDSGIFWNLTQPLSGQSQGVIDFLGEILIKP